MTPTLPRGLLGLVLAVLGAMELVALSGAVPAPHLALDPHRVSPLMAGVLAIPFLVHLRARPGRGELVATIAAAAVIAALSGPSSRPLLLAGTSLGFGSLLVLAARAAFARTGRAEARDTLSVALVFPAFFMSMVTGLALTVVLHPATYDGRLFHIDGALGGAPSFVVGRWFASSRALAEVCELVYRGIPLAAGVLLLVRPKRPEAAGTGRMLATFVASGVLGFTLYHLCPAVGPGYAFRGQFPAAAPGPSEVSFAPLAVLPFDRNCVPSLHTTWALFLLWFSRGRAAWVRIGAAFWLACTLLATLGLGEHYVVDLVIAVPFAVGVHALGASELPLRRRERSVAIGVGALLVAVWIAAIRRAAPALAGSRPLVIVLVVVSVALPLVLHRRWVEALDGAEKGTESASEAARSEPLAAVSMVALALFGAAATLDLMIAYRGAQLATGFAPGTRILAAGFGSAAVGAFAGKRVGVGAGAPLRALAYCALGLGALGAAAPRVALLPLCFLVALPFPALAARLPGRAVMGSAALGGAVGAIAGVTLLLPQLGMALSTLPALVLALVTALICLRGSRGDQGSIEGKAGQSPPSLLVPLLAAAGVAPVIALIFFERLAGAAGDSPYTAAFAVTAILLGLAGGAFSSRWVVATPRTIAVLAVAFVISVLVCAPSIPDLERYFAAFQGYKAVRDFSGGALVRFFVVAGALVPPIAVAGAVAAGASGRCAPGCGAGGVLVASFATLVMGVGRGPGGVDLMDLQSFPAASRLTREGMARTKAELAPGRGTTITIQLDRLAEDDLIAILATVQAELPSISIHVSGARASIFACPAACAPPTVEPYDFALAPEETQRLIADRARVSTGSLVMTEDDPRLMWTIPRASATPPEELLRANLRLLHARNVR